MREGKLEKQQVSLKCTVRITSLRRSNDKTGSGKSGGFHGMPKIDLPRKCTER